jgi:hypothetical protein
MIKPGLNSQMPIIRALLGTGQFAAISAGSLMTTGRDRLPS